MNSPRFECFFEDSLKQDTGNALAYAGLNCSITAEEDMVIAALIFSIPPFLILKNHHPLCYPVLTNNDLLAIESTKYNFLLIIKTV